MIEFNVSSKFEIDSGNFPLNHDCILKVVYLPDSPLRFSYFTCRSQDSGALVFILSSVPMVKKVVVSSVDEFLI